MEVRSVNIPMALEKRTDMCLRVEAGLVRIESFRKTNRVIIDSEDNEDTHAAE